MQCSVEQRRAMPFGKVLPEREDLRRVTPHSGAPRSGEGLKDF